MSLTLVSRWVRGEMEEQFVIRSSECAYLAASGRQINWELEMRNAELGAARRGEKQFGIRRAEFGIEEAPDSGESYGANLGFGSG